ncbi:Mut7-C RNAse domain-containing protein [[Eubacterium] cellulosolvens]
MIIIHFLIDGMLGKLARWLRLFGYEVDYSTTYSDEVLLQKAQQDNSVLITSDESLFKTATNKQIEAMLIKNNSLIKKLARIIHRYQLNLPSNPQFVRCPKCGFLLQQIPKEDLKDRVPAKSYQRYSEFWVCRNRSCNKIYWQGSHWSNIQKTLKALKVLLKNYGEADER